MGRLGRDRVAGPIAVGVAMLGLVLIAACGGTAPDEQAAGLTNNERTDCDIVPLSSVAELQGRVTVTDEVEQAERIASDYGRRYPSEFAGRMVTPDAIVVGFTRSVCERIEELSDLLPDWKIRGFTADYSLDELTHLADSISDDLDELKFAGVEVVAVGVLERKNRVDVMLERLDERQQGELQRRYGRDRLVFSEGRIQTVG